MKHSRLSEVAMRVCVVAMALGGAVSSVRGQVTQAGVEGGVLSATRTYFAPSQPLTVRVNSSQPVELMLIDFIGQSTSARSPGVVSGEVDVRKLFSAPLSTAGAYLLAAVPVGGGRDAFLGTPLVISVRADGRRSAPPGPMIYRVEPMRYAVLTTTAGEMKVCFYYDVAPNTVNTIQRLMGEGFYDGLAFFRVEPGFVAQTGDPRGDGTGGPGFMIDAEFSDRQHLEGVLSMARATDPNEAPGLLPRSEFANSAGSQFFICLNGLTARQLDRRYSAFGRVVEGLDVLRALSGTTVTPGSGGATGGAGGKADGPRITQARLVPVTLSDNPYSRLRIVESATTQPSVSAPVVPGPGSEAGKGYEAK